MVHHVQYGDIDTRGRDQSTPIDIKVSELGVSTREAGFIARTALKGDARKAASFIQLIIELSQMGPRTGNPVLDDTYADGIEALLRQQCPSGNVTSLMLVREMRRYPVISGEIVHLTGRCAP